MLKELEYDVLLTKTGNTLNCMGHLAFYSRGDTSLSNTITNLTKTLILKTEK